MESFAFLQVLSRNVQSAPNPSQPEDCPIYHETWLPDVEPAILQAAVAPANITASDWQDVDADELPQPRFWMMP
ncbi:hypothetical protein ACQ4M4_02175 [Leptolyngbya sp. AN02str]|uniref:hypothetical protein n=1 Tax=Leptolyngbya sp. AN02str TaxID=3423363 RepID=UPI003D318639